MKKKEIKESLLRVDVKCKKCKSLRMLKKKAEKLECRVEVAIDFRRVNTRQCQKLKAAVWVVLVTLARLLGFC